MINKTRYIDTLILGAGMAGLGAGIEAQRYGLNSLILEAASEPGGLCRNTTLHGCDFDFGPKILILDKSENSTDILSFLEDNYDKYDLIESTYLKQYGLVGFPLQRNLVDLSPSDRQKTLADMKKAQQNPKAVKTYKDWLINNYGEFFCEKVLIPYEEKKWQISLDKLDYKWALTRPVKVDVNEVIEGSKHKLPPNRMYYYPKQGNISNLTVAMAKSAGETIYNSKADHINMKEKYVLSGDSKYYFKNLVSTIPLDYSVKITKGISDVTRQVASSMLKHLSIRVFNLVYKGNFKLDGSAIYFPESDLIFRRISVLQNLCPALAREGYTPISIEVSLNKTSTQISEQDHYDTVLKDLVKIPQFAQMGVPVAHEMLEIVEAYPIQKDGLRLFVANVHAEYETYGIFHCGRGGSFDYCNSDTAYSQGKTAIRQIVEMSKAISM